MPPNEFNVPDNLKQRLRERKVVPFVGAGVSMPVRKRDPDEPLFPSWKQLLLRAAERLGKESKEKDGKFVSAGLEIDDADYLAMAQHARKALGGALWNDLLKAALDPDFKLIQPESLDLAQAVWALQSPLVITTNYDKVLRWACSTPNDLDIWDIEATAEQSASLRSGIRRPTVWHLHGQIGNVARVILTTDDYKLLYPEDSSVKDSYDAARQTLRTYLSTHTFLFVGFSFADTHLVAEVEGIQNLFAGYSGQHYALVRDSDVDRVKNLSLTSVIPIPFKEFAELPAILRQFGELASEHVGIVERAVSTTDAVPVAIQLGSRRRTNQAKQVAVAVSEPKLGPLHGRVPSLPTQLHDRYWAHRAACEAILDAKRRFGGIVGIQGSSGVGKTVLASEIVRDTSIREAFPDGVIWLSLGDSPNVIDLQEELLGLICPDSRALVSPSEQMRPLHVQLARLSLLIVLADVWDARDVSQFKDLGSGCVLLITTERCRVLSQLDGRVIELRQLPLPEAVGFLSRRLAIPDGDARIGKLAEFAKACGCLPIALNDVAVALRDKPLDRYDSALEQLRMPVAETAGHDHFGVQFSRAYASIKASVESLNPELQQRLFELAVFPPGRWIPQPALETLWHSATNPSQWMRITEELIDTFQLRRVDANFVSLHRLHHRFLQAHVRDLRPLHQGVLDAYSIRYGGGWATVPFDGYFHRNVFRHLDALDRCDEADELATIVLNRPTDIPSDVAQIYLDRAGRRGKESALAILRSSHDEAVQFKCLVQLRGRATNEARELIKHTRHPAIQAMCLDILGSAALGDAARLIRFSDDPVVLCTCLKLLGESASEDAERLLKENDNSAVQEKCIQLLGHKARAHVERLLKTSKNPAMIRLCLGILGKDARDEVRRLLRQHQRPDVVAACLKTLGKQAYNEARRFLNADSDDTVLSWCIDVLGDEAIPIARQLVHEPRSYQLICKCLRLLGEEAKEPARILIRHSKESSVLSACLNILGQEAADHAWRLLKAMPDKPVAASCLKLLGNRAKDEAKRILDESTHPHVLIACLELLQDQAKAAAKRLLRESKDPGVLHKCFEILGADALDDAQFWEHHTNNTSLIAICRRIQKR